MRSLEQAVFGDVMVQPLGVADDIAIGTGPQNTVDIIAGCGEAGIAADLGNNYVLNGYTDWFLLSLDGLQLIRTNIYELKSGIGGSWSLWYYWSSSEYASNQSNGAQALIIISGGSTGASKGDFMSVRTVRRF